MLVGFVLGRHCSGRGCVYKVSVSVMAVVGNVVVSQWEMRHQGPTHWHRMKGKPTKQNRKQERKRAMV